ncbi:hypothetical protein M0R04_08575 [Candidatus Dojkabacteria bacterium]|jgi:hypothetical protein|nr:hypothetical protein [Candidatus Dojkabacteria bacterium]
MKTLVVTDCTSLSIPRFGTNLQDTYIGKLDGFVQLLSGGGWAIKEYALRVQNVLGYYEPLAFDYGILGLGLADCAPRPIPQSVRFVVERTPFILRQRIVRYIHNHRPQMQQVKFYQYTPIDLFTQYYSEILRNVVRLCVNVIVIPIVPIKDEIEKQSPQFRSQIEVYNKQIIAMSKYYPNVKVLSLDGMTDDCLIEDAHITTAGHNYIWVQLKELIK